MTAVIILTHKTNKFGKLVMLFHVQRVVASNCNQFGSDLLCKRMISSAFPHRRPTPLSTVEPQMGVKGL